MLDQPTISADNDASSSYEGVPDFALGDGPGRGSCMHALPRPGQKHKLPPPERVVQGDNHRHHRGAAKRPRADDGSNDVSRLYKRTTRPYNQINSTVVASGRDVGVLATNEIV